MKISFIQHKSDIISHRIHGKTQKMFLAAGFLFPVGELRTVNHSDRILLFFTSHHKDTKTSV